MSKRVMVTGANGHIGNNLIKELVRRGYQVRATVRDAGDPVKTASLRQAGIEDIVSLDVRDTKAFAAASEGVELLFHLAATYRYYTGSKNADNEMLRDSIEGATAAVRAAYVNRIEKMVLTSSAVAQPLVTRGGRAVTEEDWQEDMSLPYFRAKALAEREAWKLAGELNVNMVAVLPGAVIGPGFFRGTPSTDTIEGIMLGSMKMGAPNANFPAVDIRDVVEGHMLVAEKDCSGRFTIINDHLPSFMEISRIMHEIDPTVPAANRLIPDFVVKAGGVFFDWLSARTTGAPRLMTGELVHAIAGKEWTMSNARAKRELGWQQTVTLRQSLEDTMATLRALRMKP